MSLLTVFPQKYRLQESCNLSKPHQWICTTTITTATTSCFRFRHNSHHNNHNKRAWIHLDHSCEKCEISRNFFAFFQERCTITAHHIYFCFSLYCFSHHFCYFMFFILLHPQLWKRWVYFFDLSIFYFICFSIGCLRSKCITFQINMLDNNFDIRHLLPCTFLPWTFRFLKFRG